MALPALPDSIDRLHCLPVAGGWLGLSPLPSLGKVSDLALAGPPLAGLHRDEWNWVKTLRGYRRATFAGGRAALRCAATTANVDLGPVLSGPRGAPLVPAPFCASVSHKLDPKAAPSAHGLNVAAAFLASCSRDDQRVGVDIEIVRPRRGDLARHILRPTEQEQLAQLPPQDRGRAVLRAFSMKEALYKALDPHVQRYVGFLEVELDSLVSESVSFSFELKQGEGPFAATGQFLERGAIILSIVHLATH